MDTTVNFYMVSDYDSGDVLKPYESIKSDNDMYFNLKPGDTIILKDDKVEYSIIKVVKNLHADELNIYIDRIKSKEEVMDDIEELANKALKGVLESLKETLETDK
ncbi:MAG: hypothetical protein LKE46_03185 [Clostridium sp.]|uniref:hypothetical protein n=1 Tax=Clostridium sp. TaxID=1506 RepID=UPI0025B9599E|nr:hypothetical protein [Clostridium sp.]MCH3963253.1 hypothetical protein [Clostridium sp.]MCI1717225.1 hypothetical protein [Clostridium sp.]MCI1801565.1 hypothetical protein [Clostridium sp.]MCI1815411.1 hypothetical protein [Clostridium sp.]MCI1872314.1 hypothetical protein [Clostridium sp.]